MYHYIISVYITLIRKNQYAVILFQSMALGISKCIMISGTPGIMSYLLKTFLVPIHLIIQYLYVSCVGHFDVTSVTNIKNFPPDLMPFRRH